MKKKIAAWCAAALALSALTGCAPQGEAESDVNTRIAALKGATAMGIVKMLEDNAESYTGTIYTTANEIVPLLAKEEIDIALIPTNLAATLYHKTEGGVQIIDVNAGGVLYGVANEQNRFLSVSELRGKTLYMTGKGTTPEWSLQYLLAQNNMSSDELNIEFKAEPTEIVSMLQSDPTAIALLPQPFATVATQTVDGLAIVYDLSAEWQLYSEEAVQAGTATGVTVVRRAFAEQHPEAVSRFLADHQESVDYMGNNPAEGAALVEQYGIAKAGPVQSVLENYNPLCAVSGQEMKDWVSEYLGNIYEIAPDSVGGSMPDEAFYYLD